VTNNILSLIDHYADIPALIVEVLKSNREVLPKLLWCVLVFVFPIGGMIIYYLFSNRAAHNSASGYETLPQ